MHATARRRGAIESKVARAEAELYCCNACPRRCGVDRVANKHGKGAVCMVGRHALVSAVFPHFGEEPCLQGSHGSGTIFFSGCSMKCVFCQNGDISAVRDRGAHELDATMLAKMMLKLQEDGCHNINLVTPEHVVPQVVEALAEAQRRGLWLPIVYNTSSYDTVESLQLLDGLIDIYLADIKFFGPETSRRLAHAKDYPAVARAAVLEMHRQVGDLVFSEDGIARRGLLVRHLVMPGLVDEGKRIVRWVADEVSKDTYVNGACCAGQPMCATHLTQRLCSRACTVMEQYRPTHFVGRPRRRKQSDAGVATDESGVRHASINRPVLSEEVQAVERAGREAGLHRFNSDWEDMRSASPWTTI